MLNVTQNYLNAVSHYTRDIVTRVYFNDSETPIQGDLMRVQIKELGQSSEALTLGDLCTNEATVKFIMPSVVIPLEGGYFRLEHGILVEGEYNYVSVGTFYISQIESVEGSGIYTITGYDRSKRLDVEYTPKVTLPTTVELVVKDICTQCNIALDSSFTFPNIPIETLYTASCKDTIKYMAGLMGKNAKINRNDKLTFYWYANSGIQINRSMQYMGGFKKTTDEDIVINSLTSGTEENPLVSGNGRGISFENPYMTQAILDSIYSKLKSFTYTPSNTKYNGNPALEIGDIVSVEDKQGNYHNCIVSGHDLVLTGMHGTITSKGTTEADSVMKQESPTEIKLKKFYNVMLNAFKESTDLIIGAKGGYIVTNYDDNGFPTSFEIRDTPTLTDNTKLWIFNKNGIGFSSDGGKTLSNIAIDMLGRINANVITTGKLVGENFEIDLDEGSLTMGERGSDGEFETIWFKVDSTGITQSFTDEVIQRVDELDESTTQRFIETSNSINEVQETSQQYTDTTVQNYAKITDLDETKSSLSSEISATAETIKMEVSNTYMAITKEEEIYATIRSMIEQSETDITMTFRSELSNVENTVEINKQNIEDYIRFSADGVEIGERNSPFKSNFSNTELSFSQNGEVIAYISNSTMYIKNAHVTERFTLGRISTGYYDLTVGNDSHLTWTYREEGSGS